MIHLNEILQKQNWPKDERETTIDCNFTQRRYLRAFFDQQ